ncbi:MAG: hypothetical protein LCH63_04500 [Candidatus Melainabacteria bacterium]|nr:hypothetical protein [Candidatus Melainabacteria bacterium]
MLGALGAADGMALGLVGSCLPAALELCCALRLVWGGVLVFSSFWTNSMSVTCERGGGGTKKKKARMKLLIRIEIWNIYEPEVASVISMA